MATTNITIVCYFQCPANKSEEGDVATPTQRTICQHLDIRFTDGYVQEHDAKRGAQCLQHVDAFGCNVLGTKNSYTKHEYDPAICRMNNYIPPSVLSIPIQNPF